MPIIGASTGDLTRSGHRLGYDTGTVNPLHIEEYGGEVESQFVKSSFMRQYVKIKPVRGTDTVTTARIGKTSLQAVAPGIRVIAESATGGRRNFPDTSPARTDGGWACRFGAFHGQHIPEMTSSPPLRAGEYRLSCRTRLRQT